MPATGARRGNLVYHWRHGWIPRDHFAALQKAHGSHKGAAKLMEKHGISGGHSEGHKPTSRPVGVMGRPSALDSMPSVAPRNAQMRGEHVVTAKEAAANRAAMKATSKRAEDTLKAAQKDSTGKELLAVAKQGQGTSARAAIVRAAEDAGQGNHEAARKRLETALADTRAMGPAYPGDKTHTADTRALNNAIKVLGGGATSKASPAPTHSAGMDPHAIRATQLREAAAKKRAEADRIAGSVGAPDRAGAMLRAKDSARMNARMDSGLRRFTEKQREATALEHQARLAEGRSKEAARPKLTHEDVKGATHVRDQYGWHEVVRVNAKTVTVKTPYSWTDSIPHHKVHQVLRATPEQIAAAKAKAARKK